MGLFRQPQELGGAAVARSGAGSSVECGADHRACVDLENLGPGAPCDSTAPDLRAVLVTQALSPSYGRSGVRRGCVSAEVCDGDVEPGVGYPGRILRRLGILPQEG